MGGWAVEFGAELGRLVSGWLQSVGAGEKIGDWLDWGSNLLDGMGGVWYYDDNCRRGAKGSPPERKVSRVTLRSRVSGYRAKNRR